VQANWPEQRPAPPVDFSGSRYTGACTHRKPPWKGAAAWPVRPKKATAFFCGSSSVERIVSPWRVDEIAAALLMGRLFENLTGARPDLADGGPRPARRRSRGTRDEVRAASLRIGLGEASAGERAGDAAEPAPAGPGDLRPDSDPYSWSGFVRIGP
jgi:CHAT domain-containing protein